VGYVRKYETMESWARRWKMECVIFIGMQATGKSTFYRERYFNTHIRINLDMLRTRHREQVLTKACIEARQPYVIDKTNPSIADRAKYIAPAKAAGFRVAGYYFASKLHEAMARNAGRTEAHRVPDKGLLGTHARLQLPTRGEGFDELFYVQIAADGAFSVEEWKDEI
jgi:predicted kinase